MPRGDRTVTGNCPNRALARPDVRPKKEPSLNATGEVQKTREELLKDNKINTMNRIKTG
jgi:hypothetical protein